MNLECGVATAKEIVAGLAIASTCEAIPILSESL
jgi:hypothetical protein